MKRNRELELIGISHDEYEKMVYFCHQYVKNKEKLKSLTYLTGVRYAGYSSNHQIHKPTEDTAVEFALIKNDIEVIEKTAIETDMVIYNELIKNIAEGIPFEHFSVPCGRRYFYEARTRFFAILHKKYKNLIADHQDLVNCEKRP